MRLLCSAPFALAAWTWWAPARAEAQGAVDAAPPARTGQEGAVVPLESQPELGERGPANVVAGNAGGGFGAFLTWNDPSDEYHAIHGGVWVRASVTAFVGPMNVRGEAGIGIHPAFSCKDDDEDGCGLYGDFFGTAMTGPAIAVDDRVRVFARGGVSGGFLGRRSYGFDYGELPRTEIGFAAWNPALPFWKTIAWEGSGVSLIDAALSLSYFASSSMDQAPDRTGDGFAIGVSTLAVLGPLSLEAKLDTMPGDTPLAMGTTRLCAGVFGMICVATETITAWTRDQNDGSVETKSGQSIFFTVGGGGALGIEWW